MIYVKSVTNDKNFCAKGEFAHYIFKYPKVFKKCKSVTPYSRSLYQKEGKEMKAKQDFESLSEQISNSYYRQSQIGANKMISEILKLVETWLLFLQTFGVCVGFHVSVG